MPTRVTGDGSLCVASSGAVITALLVALAVVLSPLFLPRLSDPRTSASDCTSYGLTADDSRAHPDQVLTAGYRTGGAYSETGELGEMNQTFTAHGLTGRYHVIDAGVDPAKPVGLVIHLHGDGAREYHDPSGRSTCLAAVAASHNALLVVPRTPDTTGEPTWWENLDGQRDWLESLVNDRLLPGLPVDRNRITWMGYSGGAEMLSYGILTGPRELVTAGAVMVGGGGAPETLDTSATRNQRATMQLWWVTGQQDTGRNSASSFNAVRAARTGAQFYQDEGFGGVRLDLLPGHDHFDMPDARILDDLLTSNGVPRISSK